MTVTLTSLTVSLETAYSVRASPNPALPSRFGFNIYGWESEIVLRWEIWRRKRRDPIFSEETPVNAVGTDWIYDRLAEQQRAAGPAGPGAFNIDTANPSDFDPDPWQTRELFRARTDAMEKDDSVLKVRVDQSWNLRLLWERRMKELLISADVSIGPESRTELSSSQSAGLGWRGVGVEVSYSS